MRRGCIRSEWALLCSKVCRNLAATKMGSSENLESEAEPLYQFGFERDVWSPFTGKMNIKHVDSDKWMWTQQTFPKKRKEVWRGKLSCASETEAHGNRRMTEQEALWRYNVIFVHQYDVSTPRFVKQQLWSWLPDRNLVPHLRQNSIKTSRTKLDNLVFCSPLLWYISVGLPQYEVNSSPDIMKPVKIFDDWRFSVNSTIS